MSVVTDWKQGESRRSESPWTTPATQKSFNEKKQMLHKEAVELVSMAWQP